MDQGEIKAALEAAFIECEIALCPLTDRQKQILLQMLVETIGADLARTSVESAENPLDELNPQQRQALLEYIQTQEQQNIPWKAKLLNDWLDNSNSGSVQFIRDNYGPQWLNQVQKVHLAKYWEQFPDNKLALKVGDRLEVCNGLWEWVQDDGPCKREWYPCRVVGITEVADDEASYTNCTVRFENGVEFEIQGIYQWNHYYWRFPQE